MTTEVQIRKSHAYLPRLRKIVACVAARLGMSRTGVREAEETVSQICATSIAAAGSSPDSSLSIRLDTHGDCMTVEITDPCIDFDPVCAGHSFEDKDSEDRLERVLNLVDGVEVIRGGEGTTVRVTKYARALAADSAPSLHQSRTSTLHA